MKRKAAKMFSCLIGCILALSIHISVGSALAQEKTFTLKVTNFLPTSHQISLALDQWGKDLEKATNGRVKVRMYHGGTLAGAVQQYDAVVNGIADVGNHVTGYTVNRFPLTEVLDLPLGIPSSSVGVKMMNHYYETMKPKELDDVKVLWLHGMGPGVLSTRDKPERRMEDLKGLKIRTYGGTARFVQNLGGSPVGMPMGETYDALSRGMLDGVLTPMESLASFKLGDHVKYVTRTPLTSVTSCQMVVMNKKTWNSLPQDIQKIVDRLSKEQIVNFGNAWDKGDEIGRQFMEKRGATFITLEKAEDLRWFNKGAKPLHEDYVKRMKAKNLSGDKALEVVTKFLQPYQK